MDRLDDKTFLLGLTMNGTYFLIQFSTKFSPGVFITQAVRTWPASKLFPMLASKLSWGVHPLREFACKLLRTPDKRTKLLNFDVVLFVDLIYNESSEKFN